MRLKIIDAIQDLIINDMQKLISLLYRIDVDEKKLRSVLEHNTDSDSAPIIADLVIERQASKIKSRRENFRRDKNIDDNDKW